MKPETKKLPSVVPLSCGPGPDAAPSGWQWRKLSELARLESGHTPSRRHPEWWGGDIPWIALPDIRALDGKVAFDTAEHVNANGIANSSARVLRAGTVVLSRTASVGFVTIMGRPMATSQDFVNWVCGPDLDADFLALLLTTSREFIRSLGSGAVHKTVYVPTVKSFYVCVPPIAEQKRIVAQVTQQMAEVERAHAAAETQLNAAQALSVAYIRSAFEQSKTRHWPIRRLADVCTLLPSKSIARDGETVVQAITTACLSESGFRPEGIKPARMRAASAAESVVRSGEVLVARSNTSELVGRASLFEGNPQGVVASDLTIRVGLGTRMHPPFLAAFLSFLYVTGHWREKAGGASGSMKKITRSQLADQAIPVPQIDDQKRASEALSGVLRFVRRVQETVEAQLQAIGATNQVLLRRVFGGP